MKIVFPLMLTFLLISCSTGVTKIESDETSALYNPNCNIFALDRAARAAIKEYHPEIENIDDLPSQFSIGNWANSITVSFRPDDGNWHRLPTVWIDDETCDIDLVQQFK